MDIDNAEDASAPTPSLPLLSARESGLNVSLHPLPLLSVSEHITRVRLQSNGDAVKVYGALIGVQSGRDIEITNSFELAVSSALEVDHGLFVTRRDQFKQVFPTYEFLGWYCSGSSPTHDDLRVHQQLLGYNENPLFVQLSPSSITGKDLPITVFESATELAPGGTAPQTVFMRAQYKIETGEAERIAVDHTFKPSGSTEGADTPLVTNLATQRNALKMLHERIDLIVRYLEQLAQGKVPSDPETLRQISALRASLPAASSPEFEHELLTEKTDVMLTSYLSTLTESMVPLNQLLDRASIVASQNERGGGGGGRRPGGRSLRDRGGPFDF